MGDITKEILLTIVEGGPDEEDGAGEGPAKKKRKGGYITPIARKLLLRKTRAKVRLAIGVVRIVADLVAQRRGGYARRRLGQDQAWLEGSRRAGGDGQAGEEGPYCRYKLDE